MSQLSLIIKNEYLTDIRQKGFWIGTFAAPVLLILFGVVMGLVLSDADSYNKFSNDLPITPDEDTMTAAKAAGMIVGSVLMMVLLIYGAQIFAKVKVEKCNRIMEVVCTCVDGRTMMLAKIVSVGLIGLTQILAWASLGIIAATVLFMLFPDAIPWHIFSHPLFYMSALYMLLYFVGGYIMFGSLYAACGAITDKDNENQAYMTAITMCLVFSFYIGMAAVDHSDGALSVVCTYFPLTSPIVGTINAVSGASPWWQTLVSLVLLYATAFLSVSLAGKLYRSSMLLKGKQFTPRDIVTFLKA